MVSENGIPSLIEVNTNPGMSAESIVPQMIKANGQTVKSVLTEVLGNT
jgi:D-alanine-D-alanine ligase